MPLLRRKSLEEQLLDRCLIEGEFLLRSGVMSSEKFDFERITQSKKWHDRLLQKRTERALGKLIVENMPDCDLVVAVANGANPLVAGVARHVSRMQVHRTEEVLGRETRKLPDGTFQMTQGNIYVRDRRVGVIDDAYTAGTSIGLVADTVERFGGVVTGAAVVLNRNEHGNSVVSRGDGTHDTPVYSFMQHPIPTYPAEGA
jgi:orotate phosphoribosyltransferase